LGRGAALTDGGSDVAIECLYRGTEREMRVRELGERYLCQNWLSGIDGPGGRVVCCCIVCLVRDYGCLRL
jgi:hypothetical protein